MVHKPLRHHTLSPALRQLTCVSTTPIAHYILGADFDNHVGAMVKHQIPRKIPGFKDHLGALGELMIPSNSEHCAQSSSVFVLYKDSENKYRLLPDTYKDLMEETTLGFQTMTVNHINTIFEKRVHDDDILFFFNITHSIESRDNERGRVIRSIAVGTTLRNFFFFKHLINATMMTYIKDPQLSHLTTLFNVMNTMDISLWRSYIHANPHLHNILALNYDFNDSIILSHFKNIILKDTHCTEQTVKYRRGVLQYFSSYDTSTNSTPETQVLTKIPFNLPLSQHPTDIITDFQVTRQILQFLYALSSRLNSVDYKNFNIIIFSTQQTDILTSFILTLSNFLNGFNKPYFHNDQILYFPLIELYNWEKLLEFDERSKNTKIIGTNNIILKESTEFYDFFYDLDNNLLEASPELEQHSVELSKTHDFMALTDALTRGKHNYSTTRVSLQRFNIWEITKILTGDGTDQAELNLRDYYLTMNKNIVIFDELFEFKTITLIDTLNQFIALANREHLKDEQIPAVIKQLSFFHSYVTTAVHGRLEMFFYLCEIFPMGVTLPSDLVFDMDSQMTKQNCLLNLLFKPILYKNDELQTQVLNLYTTLRSCPLNTILVNRMNPMLKVMLDEKLSSY